MPLHAIQAAVLRVIAKNRSVDSYVAGATVMHVAPGSSRLSPDLDIFHHDPQVMADCASRDAESLQAAGFAVERLNHSPTYIHAVVRRGEPIEHFFSRYACTLSGWTLMSSM
jgi:hypothetical protein